MTKTLSRELAAGPGEHMSTDDNEEILAVINRAFAGHPENGNWSMSDLKDRMNQSWFDPRGLLVQRVDGVVRAFCWTKVHPDGIGEIYLLAVDPGLAGAGSGTALTLRGLDYLREIADCQEVILYTAGENKVARSLYERLGFRIDRIDHRVLITRD